jgi:hypothetical protein
MERKEPVSSVPEEVGTEAIRLVRAADATGVRLRLLGGAAIWVRCLSARSGPLQRDYADIDVAGLSRSRQEIGRFFEAQGYAAEKLFNALHGATRLIFTDTRTGRSVDVIFDRFTMCHTIDLRDRLELDEATLSLADLLLTKLQIVQLNEKDVLDILALLADHEVDSSGDPEAVDLRRITALTTDDWGLEHTIRRTLAEARERSKRVGAAQGVVGTIEGRIDALVAGLDGFPKTRRWRMRARVGERIRWYRLPEESRR